MHNLAVDERGQFRSWGVNDSSSLGRETRNVPDPNNPGEMIPFDLLETQPLIVEYLQTIGFRAVKVAAGDSISVALSDHGDLRAWGSFRVSRHQGDHTLTVEQRGCPGL
jgi:regulator of chromosome condensation